MYEPWLPRNYKSRIYFPELLQKLTLSSIGWIIDVEPVMNFPFPSLGDLGDWNNGFNGTTGGPPWTFWLGFSTVVIRGLSRLFDWGTCPTADWSDFAWFTKYIRIISSSLRNKTWGIHVANKICRHIRWTWFRCPNIPWRLLGWRDRHRFYIHSKTDFLYVWIKVDGSLADLLSENITSPNTTIQNWEKINIVFICQLKKFFDHEK